MNSTQTQTVSQVIMEALGGRNALVAMTGARLFSHSQKSLFFYLPTGSAADRINHVTVTLNDKDLYDVTFGRQERSKKYEAISIRLDVGGESLRGCFEKETGLATSITRRYAA